MFFRSKIVNNKKSYNKYPHDAAVASTVDRLYNTAFVPFPNNPPLETTRLPMSNFPFFFNADGNRSKLPFTKLPASNPLKI
jgi:hypothetical protein